MKKIYLYLLSIFVISACSGGGGSTVDNSTPNGDITKLDVVTPYVIPVSLFESGYGVAIITNPTADTISNISYMIQNTIESGNNVSINIESATTCANIKAHSSCMLQLILPAGSQNGSFGITLSHSNYTGINRLNAESEKTSQVIGTQPVAYTNNIGLNAVQIYNYATYFGKINSTSDIILVNGVITANNTSIASIALVDSEGNNVHTALLANPFYFNPLPQAGTSFSFDVSIPTEAKGAAFYLKVTMADGSSATSTTPYIISKVPVTDAYVNYYPQTLNLESSNNTAITFSNMSIEDAESFSFSCTNQIKINSSIPSKIYRFTQTAIGLALNNPNEPFTTSSCSFSYFNGTHSVTETIPININKSQLAPTPALVHNMFITASTYSVTQMMGSGADVLCNNDAMALSGYTYKAFLATASNDIWVNAGMLPSTTYYRTDLATPVLTTNALGIPPATWTNNIDRVGTGQQFWSGQATSNTGFNTRASTCNSWTDNTAGSSTAVLGVDDSSVFANYWNGTGSPARTVCSAQLPLICVSQ